MGAVRSGNKLGRAANPSFGVTVATPIANVGVTATAADNAGGSTSDVPGG